MKLEKLADRFRIDKPDNFRLADIDPADTCRSRHRQGRGQGAARRTASSASPICRSVLYAQDRWAVLAIFQAMDAAGKDGVIKHVMSGVNPQGCQVHSFKAPINAGARPRFPVAHARSRCRSAAASASSIAPITRKCWWCASIPKYLARQKLPPQLVGEDIWEERFEDIRGFESYLARNGTLSAEILSSRFQGRAAPSASWSASTIRPSAGSSPWATSPSASFGRIHGAITRN